MLLCGLLVEAQASRVITADVKDPNFYTAIFDNDDSAAPDIATEELQQAQRYIIHREGTAPVRWRWANVWPNWKTRKSACPSPCDCVMRWPIGWSLQSGEKASAAACAILFPAARRCRRCFHIRFSAPASRFCRATA